MHIDLNCDIGEGFPYDEALMPYMSSANISCGEHAGSAETIHHTISLCKKYGVAIGAHPSFPDPENFGRKEMHIPEDELFDSLANQIVLIRFWCRVEGAVMHHVKPHGALYNMAARDRNISKTIVSVIKEIDSSIILYGSVNRYRCIIDGSTKIRSTQTDKCISMKIKNGGRKYKLYYSF